MNVEGRIGCVTRTAGVRVDDVGDRVKWRLRAQVADSPGRGEGVEEEEKEVI